MRIFLLTIFLGFAMFAAAQDTAYYYTLGTDGKDQAVYGVETNNGFTIFGNSGEVGKGASDMYVIQLNEEFAVDSFMVLGTSANEKIVDGSTDSLGRHVILSSYYDGYSSTGYDIELIYLDSNLKEISKNVIEKPDVQIPVKIQLTEAVIYVLFKDYNDVIEPVYRLVGYDYGFSEIMQIEIQGYDLLTVSSFLVNESIVVFGDYKPADSTNLDFLILKFDLTGEQIMEKSIGFFRDEMSKKVVGYNDSSFFITGSSNSSFSDDFDAFIGLVKYEDLSIVWNKTLGWNPNVTNRDEIGVNPVIGKNGNIYFGLSTETYGQGERDFHCYELLPNGDFVQGNSFGVPGDEVLEQLLFLSDSSFIFLGNTKVGGGGPSDVFLVKTKNVTFGNEIINYFVRDSTSIIDITTDLIEIESTSTEGVEIIQNENSFHVSSNGVIIDSSTLLLIYNLQGELVRSSWDRVGLNGLSEGIYVLVAQNSNFKTFSKKVIKFN
jgi:hypothetical protein